MIVLPESLVSAATMLIALLPTLVFPVSAELAGKVLMGSLVMILTSVHWELLVAPRMQLAPILQEASPVLVKMDSLVMEKPVLLEITAKNPEDPWTLAPLRPLAPPSSLV